MHLNIYDLFYSKCSHQHVSAGIPTIFRMVLLLQEYKLTNLVNRVITPIIIIIIIINIKDWIPLIRSVSRVTTALTNVSSVFQLFSFLVVCSGVISKGFGLVAFFASVKASSVCLV